MPQKSDVHIQSDKTGEDGNIDSKMSHEMNQPVGTGSTGRRHVPQTQEKVSRPIPESQKADPRQYQLNQLRRRFSLEEKEEHDATSMTFRLVPTDPDFPFEISDGGLLCLLKIPHSYPARGLPSMHVSNPDMARGYQINVERGFDSLVKSMPNSTLLGLINEFDKRLEGLLVHEKAPTIKIVTNTTGKKDVRGKLPVASATSETEKLPVASAIPETSQPSVKAQHTPQQLADAKSKRESDIRQLEARMSRVPLFSKSSDGVTFSVPLQILKSSKLPIPLQPVQSVKLLVPLLYNLEPCSILLVDAPSKEADAVQTAFERHARAHPEMTLMAHINFLAQNMRSMATEGPPATTEIQSLPPAAMKEIALDVPKDENTKSHIQVIPRPPEWDTNLHDDSGTDSSEDESSEYDTNEDDGGAALPPETQTPTASGPDLGILLSFPSLELYGAELLQLHSISLTVKCDRCKEMKDVKNVRSHASGESSLVKHESCNKCANALSIGYRGEPMHSNSVRAGYLDLDGASVVDLLPSNFIPTCSQCSTSIPAPGIVSFRGESTMTICRECHQRMTFKIPDVKFLRVSSSSAAGKNRPLPKKRPKENLGIVSGQELPRRGRCDHYAKSYRWFRFSCCSKVYPCDRCHDAAEQHPNEHANRMICGFCSREQVYRPEDCVHCHHELVRKRGGGFWEGGKGTRDKVRMSRKDPRKWKRRGAK